MSIFDAISNVHANMNFTFQDFLALDFTQPSSWLMVGVYASMSMAGIQLARGLEPYAPRISAKFHALLDRFGIHDE